MRMYLQKYVDESVLTSIWKWECTTVTSILGWECTYISMRMIVYLHLYKDVMYSTCISMRMKFTVLASLWGWECTCISMRMTMYLHLYEDEPAPPERRGCVTAAAAAGASEQRVPEWPAGVSRGRYSCWAPGPRPATPRTQQGPCKTHRRRRHIHRPTVCRDAKEADSTGASVNRWN